MLTPEQAMKELRALLLEESERCIPSHVRETLEKALPPLDRLIEESNFWG